jgi:4-amino-4-deoxy-L-arabinose transferase-like glycosyltransferase
MPSGVRASHVVIVVLVACLAAGLGLRVVAAFAWWPIGASLHDAGPYAYYASGVDPLLNPQHPPGYSVFLAALGTVTRSVGAYGVVQHLLALPAALLLFAALRRLGGSPWPGVVAAAVVLLGADQVYLERTIMSESFFVAVLAVVMYAAARMLDAPDRWWPWAAVTGVLVVALSATRSAGLFLVPVLALALLLARPRPWLPRWRPIVAFACTAMIFLLAYATANESSTGRFEVAPTGGWHLYGRVAPFADCGQFDPPPGTRGLCERSDPAARLGADWYLYDAASPAKRVFGETPFDHDEALGAFAREAVVSQPRTYARAVWNDVSAYFFPASFEWAPGRGADLDSQLDWTGPVDVRSERAIEAGMENYFFDDFTVERNPRLLGFLHDYQRIMRFGATPLTVATLLILLGLFVGSRRSRIAVLTFGVGGIAMFVVPTLSVIYIARYTVPPAPLIAGGAAQSAVALAVALSPRARRLVALAQRARSSARSPTRY